MWIRRKDYEKLLEVMEQERERNRQREDALVDRVLQRYGSRAVTPAPVEEAVSIPVEPPHPAGFEVDWKNEYAEYRYGVPSCEFLSAGGKEEVERAWQAFQVGNFNPDTVAPFDN